MTRLHGLVILLCTASPAAAEQWTAHLSYTAFLHQGPGRHFAVVDEIDTATPIEVLDCVKGWCQVASEGRLGYLPRDLLVPLEQPQFSRSTSSDNCFTAQRAGPAGGRAFAYCPAPPVIAVQP